MAGNGRDLSDEDLLGGDDDGEQVVESSGKEHDFTPSDAGKQDEDEVIGGDGKPLNDAGEDLEVVIQDEDEGQDPDGDGEGAEGAGETKGDLSLDDDGGEEIDDKIGKDFLTEWEKKNYSAAMQKRVQRERRLTATERSRADEQTVRANQAEAAAVQHRTEAIEARKVIANLLSVNLDNQIKEKTAELKAAKEGADTDAEIKAQGELDELRAQKRDVEATKTKLEAMAKEPPASSEQPPKQPAKNPLTERWLSRNKWMTDKRFAEEATITRAIDHTLGQEVKAGTFAYGPDTPQYFAEMDRRIKAKMPSLAARAQKVFQQPQSTQPRVAAVPRTTVASPTVRKGRVVLTPADLANMRNFGLDTKNPKHLQEYARNKISGENHG